MEADLARHRVDGGYDAVVSIGLLMFFSRAITLDLLAALQAAVAPGGRAVVNALLIGTTFMGMFDGDNYCLFEPEELERRFAEWKILRTEHETFPAPGGTGKVFDTAIAERG